MKTYVETKYYEVVITETLQTTVAVQAASAMEARDMVELQWYEHEHVLTANDSIGAKFKATLAR